MTGAKTQHLNAGGSCHVIDILGVTQVKKPKPAAWLMNEWDVFPVVCKDTTSHMLCVCVWLLLFAFHPIYSISLLYAFKIFFMHVPLSVQSINQDSVCEKERQGGQAAGGR